MFRGRVDCHLPCRCGEWSARAGSVRGRGRPTYAVPPRSATSATARSASRVFPQPPAPAQCDHAGEPIGVAVAAVAVRPAVSQVSAAGGCFGHPVENSSTVRSGAAGWCIRGSALRKSPAVTSRLMRGPAGTDEGSDPLWAAPAQLLTNRPRRAVNAASNWCAGVAGRPYRRGRWRGRSPTRVWPPAPTPCAAGTPGSASTGAP